jgi:hypothetical protein
VEWPSEDGTGTEYDFLVGCLEARSQAQMVTGPPGFAVHFGSITMNHQ